MVTLSVELAMAPDEARAALVEELGRLGGIELEPAEGGTRVTHRASPDLDPRELAGWYASLAHAAGAEGYADWLTERRIRRPGGPQARAEYADPTYHYPSFHAILHELALTVDDVLLEVGCGGGAFLRLALLSGCRAGAVDHSPEMVRLAREQNAGAIAEDRLQIVERDAASPPFEADTFTAAAMANVLGLLPDPVAALAEIRRVLAPRGRLIVLGSDPAWRGTPAAPELLASRIRFYADEELEQLGRTPASRTSASSASGSPSTRRRRSSAPSRARARLSSSPASTRLRRG